MKNAPHSPSPSMSFTSVFLSSKKPELVKSLFSDISNNEIEQSLTTLDINKFTKSQHAKHGILSNKPFQLSGDLTPAINSPYVENGTNAYICLCGKIMVDTEEGICEDCHKNAIICTMSGNLYILNDESCEVKAYWGVLNDKELYLYATKQIQTEKPISIISLVDNYISNGGYYSMNYKGVIYIGFQLGTGKKSQIYYVSSEEEKSGWVFAINAIAKSFQISDYYDIKGMKVLGKGKFSVVKEAIHKKTGIHVAIKGLSKELMLSEDIENLRREVGILKLCNHPNIIKLYDFFENEKYAYIIVELIEGCDLVKYSQLNEKAMDEKKCSQIMTQLISAVQYVHSLGIIHRDLKNENILMSDNTIEASVKLCDFGISKIIGNNEKCTGSYGTIGYAAPEIFLQKQYDYSVDIWGIGVIAYCLLSKGHMPFFGETEKDIIWYAVYQANSM